MHELKSTGTHLDHHLEQGGGPVGQPVLSQQLRGRGGRCHVQRCAAGTCRAAGGAQADWCAAAEWERQRQTSFSQGTPRPPTCGSVRSRPSGSASNAALYSACLRSSSLCFSSSAGFVSSVADGAPAPLPPAASPTAPGAAPAPAASAAAAAVPAGAGEGAEGATACCVPLPPGDASRTSALPPPAATAAAAASAAASPPAAAAA